MTPPYTPDSPSRAEVGQLKGPAVIDFGTNWCGHCQRAQPLIEEAFGAYSGVTHLKIEDGSGRPLGRSFSVRLWPTLIFLRDGVEVARLVRPIDADVVSQALASITSTA